MSTKIIIKVMLSFLFVKSAGFRVFRRLNKKKLVILCYHRIIKNVHPDKINMPCICVAEEQFRKQMNVLIKHYNPVSHEELLSCINTNKPLPQYAVMVTFDDGYRDNYETAYPVLKECGIPWSIFISTGYINGFEIPIFEKNNENKEGNYKKALFCTWEEISEMKDNRVTIGGHTVSHPVLSSLDRNAVENEIMLSKKEIEEKISQDVSAFAYPFGSCRDFNEETVSVVKKIGFDYACSTQYGLNCLNKYNNEEFFRLKRVCIDYNDNLDVFKMKISGAWKWFSSQ